MTIAQHGVFFVRSCFLRIADRHGETGDRRALIRRHSHRRLIGREIVAKRRAPDANWRKKPSDLHRAAAHKSGVRCPSLLGVRVLRCRNRVSPRAAARQAGREAVSYLRKRLS
ncbi:hypothetical protein HT746_09870 [Burkholderia pyrrocinia]|nr:hypothetical protein [Burkholderia pyrrocinia]NTX27429.1 hypothetical protein [Burkholderia pyrrocinia]